MSKRAGNLLSGWSQLAAKTESNMMTILSAQSVDRGRFCKHFCEEWQSYL